MNRRSLLWTLACVLAAIASAVWSVYYPMGTAPSYGPLPDCKTNPPAECFGEVDLSKTT